MSPRTTTDRNLELVAKVREIADGKGVTASQLALAWVLAQGDDLVPTIADVLPPPACAIPRR